MKQTFFLYYAVHDVKPDNISFSNYGHVRTPAHSSLLRLLSSSLTLIGVSPLYLSVKDMLNMLVSAVFCFLEHLCSRKLQSFPISHFADSLNVLMVKSLVSRQITGSG